MKNPEIKIRDPLKIIESVFLKKYSKGLYGLIINFNTKDYDHYGTIGKCGKIYGESFLFIKGSEDEFNGDPFKDSSEVTLMRDSTNYFYLKYVNQDKDQYYIMFISSDVLIKGKTIKEITNE